MRLMAEVSGGRNAPGQRLLDEPPAERAQVAFADGAHGGGRACPRGALIAGAGMSLMRAAIGEKAAGRASARGCAAAGLGHVASLRGSPLSQNPWLSRYSITSVPGAVMRIQ